MDNKGIEASINNLARVINERFSAKAEEKHKHNMDDINGLAVAFENMQTVIDGALLEVQAAKDAAEASEQAAKGSDSAELANKLRKLRNRVLFNI